MNKDLKRILELSGIISEDNSVLSYEEFRKRAIDSVIEYDNPRYFGIIGNKVSSSRIGYNILFFSNDRIEGIYGKEHDYPLIVITLDVTDDPHDYHYELEIEKDFRKIYSRDIEGNMRNGYDHALDEFYKKLDEVIRDEYQWYLKYKKKGLTEDGMFKFDYVDQPGGVITNFIDSVLNDGNNMTVIVRSGGFFADPQDFIIAQNSTNRDELEDAIRSRVEPIVKVADQNGKKLTDFVFDNSDMRNPKLKVLKDYTFRRYGGTVLRRVNK